MRTRTAQTVARVSRYAGIAVIAGLAGPVLAADSRNQDDNSGGGFSIPADSPLKGVYFAGGLGMGRSNSPKSNQDGSVTPSSITQDKTDRTLSLTVGYQFGENVSVQGGYRDLGSTDFRGESTGGPSWAAGPVRTEQDAAGWELGVMGRWPVSERWYALGYVGYYWWENNEKYTEGTFVSTLQETGGDVTYALGFEFDVGVKDRFSYRFMGSHHAVGDSNYKVNDVSAELIYRMP